MIILGEELGDNITKSIVIYTVVSFIISIIIWSLSKYWSGWPILGNNSFKETDGWWTQFKKVVWLQSRIFWILLIIIFLLFMVAPEGYDDAGSWDLITYIIGLDFDPFNYLGGIVVWFIQFILLVVSFI